MTEQLTIPGEPRLSGRIREAAGRDALGHAAVLSGQGDLTAAARFLAAALQCRGADKPCGVCPDCRKALRDIHPDVIMVTDPDHKNVSVDVLRRVASGASVLPNEGRRKVYIFPDCGLLTEQDQNVLLKIVEEGPPYAAFLFCAENPAAVLQTLRSRAGGALSEAAERVLRCLGSKKRGSAAELAARLEKKRTTREDLSAMLEECREVFSAALFLLYGQPPGENLRESASFLAKNLTKSQIVRTIEVLQKYRGECAYNIGPGHVLGALAVELEEIF